MARKRERAKQGGGDRDRRARLKSVSPKEKSQRCLQEKKKKKGLGEKLQLYLIVLVNTLVTGFTGRGQTTEEGVPTFVGVNREGFSVDVNRDLNKAGKGALRLFGCEHSRQREEQVQRPRGWPG